MTETALATARKSGPIMIGWIAQATSLRLALGLTAVLALAIAVAAKAIEAPLRVAARTP